jgi:predicted nucleic acid-binding protein
MRRVALDTSVVVAALLATHDRHEPARVTVEAALAGDGGAVLPVPVVFEAYAVLTRLPPPWRLRADAAERALRETYAQRATLIGLHDAGDAWQLVGDLAREGLVGGIAHDAQVVACARAGGATALATLNRRDFARLDLGGMTLIVP